LSKLSHRNSPPETVSIGELAKAAGVSRELLKSWRRRGLLPNVSRFDPAWISVVAIVSGTVETRMRIAARMYGVPPPRRRARLIPNASPAA
jgi:hypothetical protein